jgi:hypothetical protein
LLGSALLVACARVEQAAPSAGLDAGAGPAKTDAASVADSPAADRTGATDQSQTVVPDASTRPDVTPGGAADAACATQSAMAETLPLDLYMMMDSSGSMAQTTAAGPTKWEAVRTAMTAFFNDPQSAGIGVALQYFPLLQPGVPASCTSDGACGAFGPCDRLRTCFGPATTTIVTCAVNSDCQSGESCILLGACPLSGGYCAPTGAICLLGDPCTPADGSCHARDRCDVPSYTTSAVPIAVLPASAAGLITSLTMHQPDGLTPTGPALSGAIQSARARAAATPDRKAAVVLVTDGLPTECTPVDIPGIAAVAAAGAGGTPAVPTFVIGVFGPTEAATAAPNLDALATGGGTGRAVVIDTSQNVTQALQTALNRIRTTAVACEYKIPVPSGGAIDFGKVNVQLTGAGGASTTIGYVNGKASCDPARGGWYYDVDPATGATPTSIIACDATCTQFRSDVAARVDIVLGCKTIVIT